MSETTTETVPEGHISPKDFAELVGSDPKTVRRFLRSIASNRPGKGGRWAIPVDAVDELKARWAARSTGTTLELKVADAEDDDDAVELEDTDSYDSRHLDGADEVDELDDIDEL